MSGFAKIRVLIESLKMIKKIKCKIIRSVSFNSHRGGIGADKEFVRAEESGYIGLYTSLLSKSKKELGTDREKFNFLA